MINQVNTAHTIKLLLRSQSKSGIYKTAALEIGRSRWSVESAPLLLTTVIVQTPSLVKKVAKVRTTIQMGLRITIWVICEHGVRVVSTVTLVVVARTEDRLVFETTCATCNILEPIRHGVGDRRLYGGAGSIQIVRHVRHLVGVRVESHSVVVITEHASLRLFHSVLYLRCAPWYVSTDFKSQLSALLGSLAASCAASLA